MADPTTPNKLLFQPARGADTGTWDTPMNANTGIIDNSFGGVATISLSNANVVLSQAQYQNVFLVFTSTGAGGLAANVTITMPNIGSFYTCQNLTTNTSQFTVTLATTVAGGEYVALPPGQAMDIFTDGTNVRFRGLPPVGSYLQHASSIVPLWITACAVPPYLNCDGSTFSTTTYPILYAILGSSIRPDAKGRVLMTMNQGSNRVTSGVSGIDGDSLKAAGGDQSTQDHSHVVYLNDTGHRHALTAPLGPGVLAQASGGYLFSDGGGTGQGNTNTTTTGITINSGPGGTGSANQTGNYGVGGSQNMQPTLVAGITMIRAG